MQKIFFVPVLSKEEIIIFNMTARVYREYENAVSDFPNRTIAAVDITPMGETFRAEIMIVVDDDDDRTPTFYVDIPPTNGDEWTNIESFKYRPDAIEFAKERFHADDNGMVSLVSQS